MNVHATPDASRTTPCPGEPVHQVVLGQSQAARWLPLLTRLAGQTPSLATLCDALEDALRLAIWSREEVRLDIPAKDLPDIIEALATAAESLTGPELDRVGEILLLFSTQSTSIASSAQ